MTSRAADWFEQALRDLEQAESSRRDGRHEWACLRPTASAVTSRPPFEHFGVIHSDEALRYAREIIEFARPYVAAA